MIKKIVITIIVLLVLAVGIGYYFKINLITDLVGDMTKTEAPKQKVSEAEKQTMTDLINKKIQYLDQKKSGIPSQITNMNSSITKLNDQVKLLKALKPSEPKIAIIEKTVSLMNELISALNEYSAYATTYSAELSVKQNMVETGEITPTELNLYIETQDKIGQDLTDEMLSISKALQENNLLMQKK